MRSLTLTALLAAMATPALTVAIIRQDAASPLYLPDTTGPYKVGTVAFPLTDLTRNDPLANTTTPTPRKLMVSVFYPADPATLKQGNYSFAPDFPPQSAAILEKLVGAPEGTGKRIHMRAYESAPILLADYTTAHHAASPARHEHANNDQTPPLLIFGPGFGGSRLTYNARLQELASRGWLVVSIDHTYDAGVVEFPDGTVVLGYDADPTNYPIGGTEGVQKMRADDIEFVVRQLGGNETVQGMIPGLNGDKGHGQAGGCGGRNKLRGPGGKMRKLRTDRVGVFGHSLGGAAAAQVMNSKWNKEGRYVCGANIDGSIWGELRTSGFGDARGRPTLGPLAAGAGSGGNGLSFMQFSNANRTRASDESWGEFYESITKQGTTYRQFGVRGSEHNSFSDVPLFLKSFLGVEPPVWAYGTIDPAELVKIEVGYIDKWFEVCLKGESIDGLDGLHKGEFPQTFVGA